jgi:hypothetical protein
MANSMADGANVCWSKSLGSDTAKNRVAISFVPLHTRPVVTPALAKKFVRAARKGAGFFCLGVLLVVQSMATVPAFHAWAHQDASDPSHECAVTLFLHGQVHSPVTEVEVTKRPSCPIFYLQPRSVEFVSADVRLLPSRGPPI